jgi:predicted aconitase
VRIGPGDLRRAWERLSIASSPEIGFVGLGNPHFSLTEYARLAALVQGRTKSADVAVIVTCGRAAHEAARQAGHVAEAEAFVQFITDTCWCMLSEPVIPPTVRTLMTNSGKYAHYALGLVGRGVRFGGMAKCVEAACRAARLRRTCPHGCYRSHWVRNSPSGSSTNVASRGLEQTKRLCLRSANKRNSIGSTL